MYSEQEDKLRIGRPPRFVALAVCGLALNACMADGFQDDEGIGAREDKSICGDRTADWQDVETYNGALGPSTAFVSSKERAVGHLHPIGCSGTLIAANLFLTAGHCVSSSTPGNQVVRFNYQQAPNGTARTLDVYNVTAVLEDDIGGLDYAIISLSGNPGDTWGVSVPSVLSPTAGQPITVIQHPHGLPKKVEGGALGFGIAGRMTYGNLDTENGSSGSGILQDRTGFVIGIHTSGAVDDQCTPSNPNGGEAMGAVWQQSAVIRRLALDAAKLSVIL